MLIVKLRFDNFSQLGSPGAAVQICRTRLQPCHGRCHFRKPPALVKGPLCDAGRISRQSFPVPEKPVTQNYGLPMTSGLLLGRMAQNYGLPMTYGILLGIMAQNYGLPMTSGLLLGRMAQNYGLPMTSGLLLGRMAQNYGLPMTYGLLLGRMAQNYGLPMTLGYF